MQYDNIVFGNSCETILIVIRRSDYRRIVVRRISLPIALSKYTQKPIAKRFF